MKISNGLEPFQIGYDSNASARIEFKEIDRQKYHIPMVWSLAMGCGNPAQRRHPNIFGSGIRWSDRRELSLVSFFSCRWQNADPHMRNRDIAGPTGGMWGFRVARPRNTLRSAVVAAEAAISSMRAPLASDSFAKAAVYGLILSPWRVPMAPGIESSCAIQWAPLASSRVVSKNRAAC